MDDGVSLTSAAHPMPRRNWYQRMCDRLYWWWINLWGPKLSEESLEDIWIEVRPPPTDEQLGGHVRNMIELQSMTTRGSKWAIEMYIRMGWTSEEIQSYIVNGVLPETAKHAESCSNQNCVNPMGAYNGARACGCRQ